MQERTVSVLRANFYGLFISIFIVIPVVYLFDKLYGLDLSSVELSELKIVSFAIVSIFSILVHELIHALFFLIFSKGKSEYVKIGIMWEYLTPYVHSSNPLNQNKYSTALLAPFVFLGLIPIMIAFSLQDILVLFYGLIMVISASGDLLIFLFLLKIPKGKRILDHEEKLVFG